MFWRDHKPGNGKTNRWVGSRHTSVGNICTGSYVFNSRFHSSLTNNWKLVSSKNNCCKSLRRPYGLDLSQKKTRRNEARKTVLRPRDATQRRAAPEADWPEKTYHLTTHGCAGDFADLVLGERAVHLGRAWTTARASARSVLGDDAPNGTCTGGPTVIAGAACSFSVRFFLRLARRKVYSFAIGTIFVVRAGCQSREAAKQMAAGERRKATWWLWSTTRGAESKGHTLLNPPRQHPSTSRAPRTP